MVGKIVCFGEVLLRLSAPGRELLLQSPTFDVCIGGAEANVAVALAHLGEDARMISVLPDNALGRAARDAMRRHGVDISGIRWAEGRMGIYYMTHGAMLRPAEVLYDRVGSAFAAMAADLIDWEEVLAGAHCLHMSGITPALGPAGVREAMAAARAAQRLGVPVSMDGNYRAKLWEAWDGDSATILRDLFAHVTIAFADARDIALILGREFEGEPHDQLRAAAATAFEAFPGLDRLACTLRRQTSVEQHSLSAAMFTRTAAFAARSYDLTCVVDRVGAGDAFVGAMIHALGQGMHDQVALDFALAASVLKHSVPGDFNLVQPAEIHALTAGEGLHIRR